MIGAHMVDNASDSVYNVDAVRHGAAVQAPGILGTIGLAERVPVPPSTLGRSILWRMGDN